MIDRNSDYKRKDIFTYKASGTMFYQNCGLLLKYLFLVLRKAA
jgi:hypothetical protein